MEVASQVSIFVLRSASTAFCLDKASFRRLLAAAAYNINKQQTTQNSCFEYAIIKCIV